MSYNFVEYKRPSTNKSIDLDFNNDIIYNSLIGDELDKYNTPYIINNVTPTQNKQINIAPKKEKQSVFFVFIICVIIIMLIWYFFGININHSKKQIDTITNNSDLVMLSPDFGFGKRLVRK